jgi:hypothetical protein
MIELLIFALAMVIFVLASVRFGVDSRRLPGSAERNL